MDLPAARENLELFNEKVKAHLRRERRVMPNVYPITAKTGMDLQPVIQALARMVTDPAIKPKRPKAHEDADEE